MNDRVRSVLCSDIVVGSKLCFDEQFNCLFRREAIATGLASSLDLGRITIVGVFLIK